MDIKNLAKAKAAAEKLNTVEGALMALHTSEPIDITIGKFKLPGRRDVLAAHLGAVLEEIRAEILAELRALGVEP